MSMILIQRQVLSSSAASVTFSNIPQNYKTLRLLVSVRYDGSLPDSLAVRLNSLTTNNSSMWVAGNGSAASSATDSSSNLVAGYICVPGTNFTANTFGSIDVSIPNYSGATAKVLSGDAVSENNGTTAWQSLLAALQTSTAAITSIRVAPFSGGNFVANSSFSLYGLL